MAVIANRASMRPEWLRGADHALISPWWTVFAGSLGCTVGAGIFVTYVWSILGKAAATDFHWDRRTLAICLSCFLFATGFGTVSLGSAIGRFGVRKATVAYVAVFGFSVAVISWLPGTPLLFYVLFGLMGIGGAAATAMPYAIAITGWFDRQRGAALALMVAGSGLGATFAPHLANHLLSAFGWQLSVRIVAGLMTIVPLLGILFLVREPPALTDACARPPFTTTLSLRLYLATKEFWLIALPILGVSMATIGVLTSLLVPLLGDRGFENAQIATILSCAGVGSWIGRLVAGYAMDKIFAPYVTATVLLLTLAGIGLIAFGATGDLVYFGAALIGLALGSEADLIAFLVSRYFPLDIYSKVLGVMWVMWAWGGGIGTYVAGLTFDLTHSYAVSLTAFATLLSAAAVVICQLGPYHFPAQERVQA